VKRQELLRKIRKQAKVHDLNLDEVRDSGIHTIFRVGQAQFSVPRHAEINELTAQGIMRYLESEFGKGWWR
jgi:hypothetical protein